MKLTAKQQRFCEEYLIDCNATQAAARAGYSQKTAYSIGVENLKKPEIQEYLDELRRQQAARTKIEADRVVKALAAIGFAEGDNIKTADKLKALQMLGKHYGIFDKSPNDNAETLERLDNVLKMVTGGDDPLTASLKDLAKELDKKGGD